MSHNTILTVPQPPRAVFPGSFNPLHDGHRHLAAVAARVLAVPVVFELSTVNVDKPPLSAEAVAGRAKQFEGYAELVCTTAATFPEKAALFPGAWFVVGYDTALRLFDPKYYGGVAARDEGLRRVIGHGCRFLVGGRVVNGVFRTWESDDVFRGLTEAEFRRDVSSTQLRGT